MRAGSVKRRERYEDAARRYIRGLDMRTDEA